MQIKIGFDVHGVLDKDPTFFLDLLFRLVATGAEVHILTGALRDKRFRKAFAGLGFIEGIHFTHFFSIAQYHQDIQTEMWFDEKERPWLDETLWNKTKGDYAHRVGLTEHWDDSEEYREAFVDIPFYMYQNNLCQKHYADLAKPPLRKIALLGGAFNPPHKAHVALANRVLKEVDSLLVLPSSFHRHKGKQSVSFSDRYAMCQLAFEGLSNTTVSAQEFDLEFIDEAAEGLGSTYRLISFLKWALREQQVELYFVMGEDNIKSIASWYKWKELLESIRILSFPRGASKEIPLWATQNGNVFLKDFAVMEDSSSAIRDGDSSFVSEAVLKYYSKLNLYPSSSDYNALL